MFIFEHNVASKSGANLYVCTPMIDSGGIGRFEKISNNKDDYSISSRPARLCYYTSHLPDCSNNSCQSVEVKNGRVIMVCLSVVPSISHVIHTSMEYF